VFVYSALHVHLVSMREEYYEMWQWHVVTFVTAWKFMRRPFPCFFLQREVVEGMFLNVFRYFFWGECSYMTLYAHSVIVVLLWGCRVFTVDLLWVYHGFTVGLLWIYRGFTVGLLWVTLDFLWVYCLFTVGLLWVYCGFTVCLLLIYCGFTMDLPWVYPGFTLGLPWV